MGQTFLGQRKAVLSPLLSVESHSSQLTPQRVLHQATKSLINLKQDCSSKGQINQKNEIFSLSLYLHQTLKRNILNEIWVKIFLPNPLQKDKYQNPSISKDFTKTLLKLQRDGLETTRRQCWSSGRKNVLRKLRFLPIPYCRLNAGFSVC